MKYNSIAEIPDRRLEGETELRKVQLTTLYILDVIDYICSAHGIKYFLAFGTLLGAMRHKGFIPWDDDLDIGMLYDDYVRFLKIAPKVLPPNMLLQTPSTVPGAFEAFAKVRDLSSLAIEPHSSLARPSGIYVDIFPYVKSPRVGGTFAHLIIRGMSVAWRRSRLHRAADHRFALGVVWSGICSMGWTVLRGLLHVVWFAFRCVTSTRYRELSEAGGKYPEVPFSYDDIFPLRDVEFEGGGYPAPQNSELMLEKYYGDWRKLPPESDRNGHHSSIFYPVVPMGFWWTIPHASMSKEYSDELRRYAAPWYLVKLHK